MGADAARRHRPRWRARGGFSLVELIVSLTIFSIVMGSLMAVVISTQRRYTEQRERVRAQEALRVAQMTLTTLLRAAGADPVNSQRTLLDVDPDRNGVFDDLRVVTDFNPMDGVVTGPLEDVQVWVKKDTLWIRWQAGAAPQPLAWPIRSMRFEYYANNGKQYTDAAQTVGATRAKFILESPRDARTNQLERSEAWWVNLRNRQGL